VMPRAGNRRTLTGELGSRSTCRSSVRQRDDTKRLLFRGRDVLIGKTLVPLDIRAFLLCGQTRRGKHSFAADHAMADMIFIETPSNPMNSLVDIAPVRRVSEETRRKQGSLPITCCANVGETEPLPARDFVSWRFSDSCGRRAWIETYT
jgi:hypothetical protein